MKAIKIEDLYKRFNTTEVIQGLSLEIEEGEIFGLLGPNGAGKSTTINILCYLLPYDKGTMTVFDKPHHQEQREIKKGLGVVPQELAIFEELSAFENVRFFGELYGLRKEKLRQRTREALAFVGLGEKEKDKAKTFSGGMKRRLNIACGIVHEPRLVIMDEPTVGIDPQSRNYILQAIKRLKDKGTTVIYTTHYMEEAEQLCDRIAIMDEGRVLEIGTANELKNIMSEHHTLEIVVGTIDPIQIEPLRQIKGVQQIHLTEQKLTIISSKEVPCITEVIEALAAQKVSLLAINTKVHSLEDVFLTLTGKKLRD
ncbi:MAG: ABC transporter ATP-binding protein [Cellulosilyticaceae bacterium]